MVGESARGRRGMDDQRAVVAFLSDPLQQGGPVDLVETHSAWVFLAGERAYKLKRAVKYDFLDFSDVAHRRQACLDEVRLNARTAPDIYLRAAPIVRDEAGRLGIGGEGDAVDWVVVMRRFDQSGLLDRLAATESLPISLMRELADEVAHLHDVAGVRTDHGGFDGMSWVVERNAVVFGEYAEVLPPETAARVSQGSRDQLIRLRSRLDRRRESGHVRECHGDLHLRNIVLVDGRPVLFDCIEFNDRISCTDVLYDLAFLVMDLLRVGLRSHASALLNRYLEVRDELDGLALMPLFLSARAAVRAKVTAIEATLTRDVAQSARDQALARTFLDEAAAFLEPVPPRLVAIGGLSGTGKSTLAARLAPSLGRAPGAIVLRSDVIRKRLFGKKPEEQLAKGAYTPDVSTLVYGELCARARTALEAGYAVIADAVFADPTTRERIEQTAKDAGVPFAPLWLDAPAEVLKTRVDTRSRDASDATATVVERQLKHDTGAIRWTRIDASDGPEAVADRAADTIAGNSRPPAP